MLRSFAEFFRQHRTLADVYELTQAVREESSDGGLPDVLLGRVRALMRVGVRHALAGRRRAGTPRCCSPPGWRTPACSTSRRPRPRSASGRSPTGRHAGRRRRASGAPHELRTALRAAEDQRRRHRAAALRPDHDRHASRWSTGSATPARSAPPTCRCSRRSPRTPRSRWRTPGWSTGCATTPTTTGSPPCPTGGGSSTRWPSRSRCGAEARSSRCCCSTSTASATSTSRWATPPATSCSPRWPSGCAPSPARARWSAGSAATSSW